MNYYIIAGEASGDLHASNLMKGIYAEDPDAVIRFRGGDKMLAQYRQEPGGGIAKDYREGAVMGFFELVGKAGSLIRDISFCKRDILNFRPDALILVDYPGFNLRIAGWAHKKGIRVFYYIAPKVWASREWRIRQIRRHVDRLYIVFPFEKEYFASKNVPYLYFGNPLVDCVASSHAMSVPREELKKELGLDPHRPVIALLAGSRKGEVNTMMPLLKQTVKILRSKPQFEDTQFVIAGAPGRTEDDYGQFDREAISIRFGLTQEIVRAADAAVINSGTASLEAVLLDTPQVIAYKIASSLTYYLAKWFLFKGKYISLGNLCINALAFKEFYHKEDCTPESVAAEVERLVCDKEYRAAMKNDYAKIRACLGGEGASSRVARDMLQALSKE